FIKELYDSQTDNHDPYKRYWHLDRLTTPYIVSRNRLYAFPLNVFRLPGVDIISGGGGYGFSLARSALRRQNIAQRSRVYRDSRSHDGAWDRGQYSHFQRDRGGPFASFPIQGPRPTGPLDRC